MPSTPPDLLARLLKDVERASGMEITCTRDCEVLSEELRAFDGRFPVSVSTLRRCFGLIEAPGGFSQTTLNTLARYVGYPSFRAWSSTPQDPTTAARTQPRPTLGPGQGQPVSCGFSSFFQTDGDAHRKRRCR